MTGQRFRPTGPIIPPTDARAFYLRNAVVIPWNREKSRLVSRQYRALKKVWKFDPNPDGIWDSPEVFTTEEGRVIFEGNCNDFAPALKRSLVTAGLPEEAMSLVKCRYAGKGHMVLSIETSPGSLICCNIVGCWGLGRPALRHHEILSREAPGRPWESLEPLDLGDIWPSHP